MAVTKRRNRFDFLTKKFPKRMQEKLVMVFMAVVLAFVALIGKITYINASKGSGYTKIVLEQQQYDSRVIPYKRGDIVDCNGTRIATSERVYNVILDVYVMLSEEEYAKPTMEVLESLFGIPKETVEGSEPFDLLEAIGKKRGMLLPGGAIHTERAAIMVVDEFRGGVLGRITLEQCS